MYGEMLNEHGDPVQLEASIHTIVAANGWKLNNTVQGTLQIVVGPMSKSNVVLMAQNLCDECLLGTEILMRHGSVLDLQQNKYCSQRKGLYTFHAIGK